MDVSFSANQWKLYEIQNLDPKLQEQFYASTPYNLNDFKDISKSPNPIFKPIQNNALMQNHCIKKELIQKENISLAIFIAYLHEFLSFLTQKIQKKNNKPQSSPKLPSQSHLNLSKAQNIQKSKQNEDEPIQTNRNLIEPQESQKNRDFQVLKNLKLKIYQIDLCKLTNIPPKFQKYYQNNLLKKIIFQYLYKVLYNVSLIEILLENNQLLCFALTLISQSLLYKKQKIEYYNQYRTFHQEASAFLEHFDAVELPQTSVIKSKNSLPLSLLINQHNNQKISQIQQKSDKVQNYLKFSLTKNQMKSKHTWLIGEIKPQGGQIYYFYLLKEKVASNTQISLPTSSHVKSPKKVNKKASSENSKKSLQSKKHIPPLSDQKLQQYNKKSCWVKYFGCLSYFCMDDVKK